MVVRFIVHVGRQTSQNPIKSHGELHGFLLHDIFKIRKHVLKKSAFAFTWQNPFSIQFHSLFESL